MNCQSASPVRKSVGYGAELGAPQAGNHHHVRGNRHRMAADQAINHATGTHPITNSGWAVSTPHPLVDPILMVYWSVAAKMPRAARQYLSWPLPAGRRSDHWLPLRRPKLATGKPAHYRLREILTPIWHDTVRPVGFDFPVSYARGLWPSVFLSGPASARRMGTRLLPISKMARTTRTTGSRVAKRTQCGSRAANVSPSGAVRQARSAPCLATVRIIAVYEAEGPLRKNAFLTSRFTACNRAGSLAALFLLAVRRLTGILLSAAPARSPAPGPHTPIWAVRTCLRPLRCAKATAPPHLAKSIPRSCHPAASGAVRTQPKCARSPGHFADLDGSGRARHECFAAIPP